jgi:fluoride exporter
MNQVVLVVVGGGLGSGARYLVSTWALARLGSGFPWGTLTVNVVGSLLLGAMVQLGISTELIGPETRLFLATGVLGGFTTYSTFNYETLGYLQEGNWSMAVANAAITLGACLLAGITGVAIARATTGG